MKKAFTLLVMVPMIAAYGCTSTGEMNKAGKGATIGALGGAAAGALAGQAIGRNTKGTLLGAAIGGAVGAAAGAGVGHAMDQQEAEYRQALATSDAAAVQREGDMLSIILKGDVTFDTGSATIKPGLYNEIGRIAEVMARYPQTRVIVEGHTDSVGKEDSNQKLSERRAQAVANMLIQHGVDQFRISSTGFGETQPVSTNDTADGRQRNRRVEIKLNPGNTGAAG